MMETSKTPDYDRASSLTLVSPSFGLTHAPTTIDILVVLTFHYEPLVLTWKVHYASGLVFFFFFLIQSFNAQREFFFFFFLPP